jgi:hypothetical protein
MLNVRTDAYIQAAIEGEVANLMRANLGQRNDTLFKATANLASMALLEGRIIDALRPAAESVGLRRREFYSTIKSGMKAGRSRPRQLPGQVTYPQNLSIAAEVRHGARPDELPKRTHADANGQQPRFFIGGDEGPRGAPDEIRRHVYRRGGKPVRIKIKRKDGFVNWYRVADGREHGWQAGKPENYVPCPYTGGLDPFDPELAGDLLFWPEGEKDCERLGEQAFPAFTFGGTGDGLPAGCAEYVRGRQLVILSDNDPAGRQHAARKAELASGLAASITVVEFPELPHGGDVSDFLRLHNADALKSRVAETPPWTPGPATPAIAEDVKLDRALVTCNLSDVAPEKVEWLWPGRVAIGKLTMIAGEPGLGKSQLSIAIAAAVTTGAAWPDRSGCAPAGDVIILSAEDGVADTIRPRFDAAGGDASKVTVIRSTASGDGRRRSFDLGADLILLEDQIKRRPEARLVTIDPASSYMGRVDSHKNADVRSVLEPLAEMAERLRVAIVAITHFSKGDGKAINRFVGSIAYVAAARTAFAVVADPDDPAKLRRLFLHVKNNIAAPPAGLAFRVLQREVAPGILGSAIDWDDTAPVRASVDEVLSGGAYGNVASATEEACELLRDILSAGPLDVIEIEAQARAVAMLSDSKRLNESKPFRAAAEKLGIKKTRVGFGPGAKAQWALPDAASEFRGRQ